MSWIKWQRKELNSKATVKEAFESTIKAAFEVSGCDDRSLKLHTIQAGLASNGVAWRFGARSASMERGASAYEILVQGEGTTKEVAEQKMLASLEKSAKLFAERLTMQNAHRREMGREVHVSFSRFVF
jgi:hypothetical protein